ncbi:MAG: T9SS type A sorting domain-containing protein [Melioribacteraceae bacterium]|nr:T9SS type A sorting domain-containing protein [Melioribacteraceae bacterium]
MGKIYDFSNFLKLVLVLVLLTSSMSNAQTTVTWTGVNDTSWSDGRNWNPGSPGSEDIVNIPPGLTNYPNITSDITIKELLNYGNVTLTSGILEVGYMLIRNNATFNQVDGTVRVQELWCNLIGEDNKYLATGGTIVFVADADYIGSNTRLQYQGIQFNNVVIEAGSTVDFNYNNKGSFIDIKISGDFTNQNPDLDITEAVFIFNGSEEQSITSASNEGKSTFGELEVNKTGGNLNILSYLEIEISLTDPDELMVDNGNMIIVAGQALPVELTSFRVNTNKNSVNLFWATATEVNNYGFEVESSQDEETWETAGFVEGHGNSNSPKEYSFTVVTDGFGSYSYRLKQIDTDGAFEYFGPVKAEFDEVQGVLLKQNYPNPFNPATTISFGFDKVENAKLTVYNVLGKEVATLFNGKADANRVYKVNFDASNLASGTYFYQIQTDKSVETKKMNLVK